MQPYKTSVMLLLPCKNKSGHADFAPYREDAEVALDVPLTNRSAKDVFFPQVENLLTFKMSGKELALEQNIPPAGVTIVMGVRACDARSFKILDKVFLKAPVDTYYKTARAMRAHRLRLQRSRRNLLLPCLWH